MCTLPARCSAYADLAVVPPCRYRCGPAGVDFKYKKFVASLVEGIVLGAKVLGAEVCSIKRRQAGGKGVGCDSVSTAEAGQYTQYTLACKQMCKLTIDRYRDL